MIEGKPDIETVLEQEGVALKRRGRHLWGLCPFHDDRNPSFKVDPDRQTFHCFGCGAHGDAVDFTQRLHGLTFKDALKHLGLEPGKPPKVDGKEKRKRELIRQFRQWEREKYRELTDEYRLITQIICRCKTMEEVSNFAGLMHEIPILEYKMDVLTSGTDEAKYGLYRASF